MFHLERQGGDSAQSRARPILYSKSPDEVEIARVLKSFLKSEDLEKERFFMNRICDRVINGRPFLNSVLAEQDSLEHAGDSKFVEFQMTEKPLSGEKALAKE